MAYLEQNSSVEKVIYNYWELREEPHFPFDSHEINQISIPEIRSRYKEYQLAYNEVCALLRKLKPKDFSEDVELLKAQITFLIRKLSDENYRAISRNQGTVIDNAVYSEIIQSLRYVMKYRTLRPIVLYRTMDANDALNPEPLVNILAQRRSVLDKSSFSNYLNVVAFIDLLIDDIQKQWNSEDLKIQV